MSKKLIAGMLAFTLLFISACGTQTEVAEKEEVVASLQAELAEVEAEYASYKEKMKPYDELDAAEAEARRIEAERVAAEKKAADEKAAQEAAAAAEAEAKKGYDTGITFSQLARNPEAYIGQKIKFTGEVVQVIEGTDSVTLRIAIDSDYDQIMMVVYDTDIVSQRVLEDDILTIYGSSLGTYTYESTMGASITVPAATIDKIDFR